MLRRVKQAVRILSYKAPAVHPDLHVFQGHSEYCVQTTRAGWRIARFLEYIVAVVIGSVAYHVLKLYILPGQRLVVSTRAGQAIVALFSILAYSVLEKARFEIASSIGRVLNLAPYFGHKIENARRILKA